MALTHKFFTRKIKFALDERWGSQYEYNEQGQPMHFKMLLTGTATVERLGFTAQCELSHEECESIMLIVDGAAQRAITAAMQELT